MKRRCLDRFRRMHDCLVPFTGWLGNIFDSIRKTAHRVRAVDMRNVLLLLPFVLHNHLEEVVAEYNRKNDFNPICDPSDQRIQMVLLLLEWYHLYRQCFPPKDEVDIKDLQALSLRF
jgi:hypothetical protein